MCDMAGIGCFRPLDKNWGESGNSGEDGLISPLQKDVKGTIHAKPDAQGFCLSKVPPKNLGLAIEPKYASRATAGSNRTYVGIRVV
jgi:hypothetical protein